MSSEPGKVLLISHEREAPAAVVGALLQQRGFEAQTHVVLEDPQHPNTDFPDPADFDLVVAFGSWHNAYDESAQGWIGREVDYINQLRAHGTGYFGICFGAQLLGQALGGSVELIPGEAEVGAIHVAPEGALPFPSGPWFSWHEDHINLPEDVEVLAHNGNAVQVFKAPGVIGVQFHPEANMTLVTDWATLGADHLPDSWTSQQLIDTWAAAEPEAHRNCEALVDWVVAELVDTPA